MANPMLPPLITLTTDFGLTDMYVGVMKGVILGIAPDARLIDLTHGIAPQNIREASARLDANVDFFPTGTIHIVVVDPGVGSVRAACVAQTETALFVAPDNGVLSLPLRRRNVQRIVRLTERARPYLRPQISATFHGRDVFAPVAAHLARGLSLEALGEDDSLESLVTLSDTEPQTGFDSAGRPLLRMPILYADHFGNLVTALSLAFWQGWREETGTLGMEEAPIQVAAGSRVWTGIARTFADVPIGSPLAYWGSDGRLEIGVRDGHAARTLGLASEDFVTLTLFLPV